GSDGAWLALAVRDERDWQALCSVVPFPPAVGSLATAEERREHAAEVEGPLAAWAADRPADEAVGLLLGQGVPAGLVREPGEVQSQPQLAHNQQWEDLTDHGEPITVQNLPYRMDGRVQHWRSFAVPGADTQPVLRDILGL